MPIWCAWAVVRTWPSRDNRSRNFSTGQARDTPDWLVERWRRRGSVLIRALWWIAKVECHYSLGLGLWLMSKNQHRPIPFRASWLCWCRCCWRWECRTCCACSNRAGSYRWRRYWTWRPPKDATSPRLHLASNFIWGRWGSGLGLCGRNWVRLRSMPWSGRKGPSRWPPFQKYCPARN